MLSEYFFFAICELKVHYFYYYTRRYLVATEILLFFLVLNSNGTLVRSVMVRLWCPIMVSGYVPVMVWLWSGYSPVMVQLWSGYGTVIIRLWSGYSFSCSCTVTGTGSSKQHLLRKNENIAVAAKYLLVVRVLNLRGTYCRKVL